MWIRVPKIYFHFHPYDIQFIQYNNTTQWGVSITKFNSFIFLASPFLYQTYTFFFWFHCDFKSNLICVQNIEIIILYIRTFDRSRWIYCSFSYIIIFLHSKRIISIDMILGGYWFI